MKQLGLILFVVVVLAVWFLTPVRQWLSKEHLEEIRFWIVAWGMWAPVVFVAVYAAATVFVVPGSVLTLAAGMIFGVWQGTVIALTAATLGATAAFIVGRYLAREVVQQRLAGRGIRLNERMANQGFSLVVWCRLIPLIPFNLFNYACSLTPLSLKDFFLGSLVGMIPGAFAFVSIGSAIAQHQLTDGHVWSRVEVWGPFALLGILMLVPKIFKGVRQKLETVVGGKPAG